MLGFLRVCSLRLTLIVSLAIYCKLNVEQDILVLIPACSGILFSTVLIWDHSHPPNFVNSTGGSV